MTLESAAFWVWQHIPEDGDPKYFLCERNGPSQANPRKQRTDTKLYDNTINTFQQILFGLNYYFTISVSASKKITLLHVILHNFSPIILAISERSAPSTPPLPPAKPPSRHLFSNISILHSYGLCLYFSTEWPVYRNYPTSCRSRFIKRLSLPHKTLIPRVLTTTRELPAGWSFRECTVSSFITHATTLMPRRSSRLH